MTRPAAYAIASPGPLKAWWVAVRPPTLTIAITPVLVGTALAWHEAGGIGWVVALVALCAAVLIQIGTNLYNDVGDYERGADGADRLGPPRASSMGRLAPADVRRAAATSFGLGMVLGAYLVSVGGWPIFVIGLASVAAGIAYTGGPRPIAYTASGEFFVFVFFGLVATVGSCFLQTGQFSWASAAAGGMIGALARLELVKRRGTVAVHPVCSLRKQGLEGKRKRIGEACAERVAIPAEAGCGRWAGDKGFTVPELNAHALRDLRAALPAGCEAGYSTSRTCEIGLALHSGVPYRSIVYLVDSCAVVCTVSKSMDDRPVSSAEQQASFLDRSDWS